MTPAISITARLNGTSGIPTPLSSINPGPRLYPGGPCCDRRIIGDHSSPHRVHRERRKLLHTQEYACPRTTAVQGPQGAIYGFLRPWGGDCEVTGAVDGAAWHSRSDRCAF